MVFLFSFKKNHSRGKCNLLNYLCNLLANGEWEGRRSSLKYFDLEKNYFTLVYNMLLFRRHWIIFSKPKPYILLDTALLINYISRPRMMTWLRENWRLYHIRCEIRSEIKGIGNVASYWVSSWDSWLLLSYLSLILRVFLLAKIVRLVMHNNREFKQRRRRRFINGKKKKKNVKLNVIVLLP